MIAEYKHKGDGVLVEGALRHDQWENGEGQIRSRITLTADSVQFTTMPEEDYDDEDFEDVVVEEPEPPRARTRKASAASRAAPPATQMQRKGASAIGPVRNLSAGEQGTAASTVG